MRLSISILIVSLFSISLSNTYAGNVVASSESPLNGAVTNQCSGSIVNIGRNENDYAVVLTNGHCVKFKSLPAGIYVKDEDYVRSTIEVFNKDGVTTSVTPRKILYGTMEGSDIGLVEIGITYKELKKLGIKIFELSKEDSLPGEELFLVSGYWKTSQSCTFTHTAKKVLEGNWVFLNAMAMNPACIIQGGWSGSPIISKISGKIVGVVNTANDGGTACTLNNPCEKNPDGSTISVTGRAYGLPTSAFWSCLSNGNIDLTIPGCKLFKNKQFVNPYNDNLSIEQKLAWIKKLVEEYPSKTIDISIVDYDLSHMSTSSADRLFVSRPILGSYTLHELLFYTCHELGHHFGSKTATILGSGGLSVEAEADYFAGSCISHFTNKWEDDLRPYLSLYKASNYKRCENDDHCNTMVNLITQSFQSLYGISIFPDRDLNVKFPEGINESYPEANCRALSAISGVLEVDRPSCWYNPHPLK